MLLFVADLLARRFDKVDNWRVTLRPVLVVFGAFAVLLMLQPNLGTTIILASIVFVMLFVSGVELKPLVLAFAVGGVLAAMAATLEPYRRRRLLGFLDPWKDSQNTGYQTIQSQVGVARGGITGSGLGESRAKWGFLPFAHTDFIFAIIGEELGLIGAVLVVALFVALGVVGVRTALRAPDRFGMLLATGITVVDPRPGVRQHRRGGRRAARSPACRCRSCPSAARRSWSRMASGGLLLNVARQAR